MSYVNIRHYGTTHHEWLNTLDFYQEDLDILDNRLLEVAGKNTSQDAGKGVEHFQNQFSIQQKNISDLRHRIRNNEKRAAGDVKAHANHIGLDVMSTKAIISDEMERFETNMKELRHEFHVFLSKWM